MKKIVILQILKQNKNRYKMNKSMKMWMMAAILVFCGALVSGCQNKNEKAKPEKKEKVEKTEKTKTKTNLADPNAYLGKVDDYLVSEIGSRYSQGEVCIPVAFVISADNGNTDDVKVWGDFWVFNFNISGDTLKTVSGGSHPGLMHLKQTENGYVVTSFEQVEDGAGNLESAKRIFGDKYDSFHEINSNAEKREDIRLHFVADYVKKNNLKATMLQDYGWPAVALPN